METQNLPEIHKIKIICRMQDGVCREQILLDGTETDNAETRQAQRLLHTFSPAAQTAELARRCGENAVLVFRTDTGQMAEFSALLKEHDSGLSDEQCSNI